MILCTPLIFGYEIDNPTIPHLSRSDKVNYTLVSVNDSYFWQGYTPSTLPFFVRKAGDVMTGDLNITAPARLRVGTTIYADESLYSASGQFDFNSATLVQLLQVVTNQLTTDLISDLSASNFINMNNLGDISFSDTLGGQVKLDNTYMEDNIILSFGSAKDTQMYYDGTNFVINPKAVGTGKTINQGNLDVVGNVNATGNITSSSLTSTRVPYASTGGLLIDTPNMTYSSGILYVGRFRINQYMDSAGFTLAGYDDMAGSTFSIAMNPSGTSLMTGSAGVLFQAGSGGAGSYWFRTGSATDKLYFADTNSAETQFGLGGGNLTMLSNASAIVFGTARSGSIHYNKTDLIINPKVKGNGNLIIDGNIDVTGNFTGNQLYGEMWFHNDAGVNLNFAVASTYYPQNVTNTQKTNGFNFTTGTPTYPSTLKAMFPGRYIVNYHASGSGVSNHNYHCAVSVNNVTQYNTETHFRTGTANDVVTMSGTGILSLNKEDNVTLVFEDSTGTGAGTVYSINVNLVRVGT
jgi:hypothetical protein